MNTIQTQSLKRISKHSARKLWGNSGVTISMCPVKLMPDGPWRPNVDYFPEAQREREFDKAVNEFEWYNCQMNETGYYTAFYERL